MKTVRIEDLKEEHFRPKWVLNGFPKSGLHWVSLMLMPLARPQSEEHEVWSEPWAGTFQMNSWTNYTVPLERVTYKIGRLLDGHFIKSHSAYSRELEQFLWHLGASVVFVYRDFRDVAVSQAYHVLSEDDTRWAHPDKELYRGLDSFDEVLRAVILGIYNGNGIEYPGVMDRWQYYAGWLDVAWIYKVRFEDLVADTHEAAKGIIRHGLQRAANVFGLEPTVMEENLDVMASWMVKAGQMTDRSPTFREGKTGGWREYLGNGLGRLLAETDRDGWLARLGYVEDENWWKQAA